MDLPARQRTVERLVDEHYQALYRYAYRLSGSPGDAEDLTQETFCRAQRNLDQLRDAGRAKPWLFSILRNAYLHRVGIYPIGRFGEWKYVNQDGAILSAKRVVEAVQSREQPRAASEPASAGNGAPRRVTPA